MHKNTYRVFVIGILCFLLTTGVIMGYRFGKDIAKKDKIRSIDISEKNNDIGDFQTQDIKVNAEPVLKEEFKIVKKTKYTLCSHEEYVENTVIAKDVEEALKTVEKGYEFESKNSNSIIVSKTINGYCSSHYLVKLNDDKKIMVYKLIDKEKSEVYSNIDVPINTLREDVIEDLKNGIYVNSLEEINKLKQELES